MLRPATSSTRSPIVPRAWPTAASVLSICWPDTRSHRRHRDDCTCSRSTCPITSPITSSTSPTTPCATAPVCRTSNCAATTKSTSMPWAPAAFPTRPPPATSAAAFAPPTSTRYRHLNQVRQRVWAQQPAAFFDQAILDMDGTLVETTGACKHGMDIAYDGTWGYHPLVVTLANTGEVLSLLNGRATGPPTKALPPKSIVPWRLLRRRLPPGAAAWRHRLHADQAPGRWAPTRGCASSSAWMPRGQEHLGR